MRNDSRRTILTFVGVITMMPSKSKAVRDVMNIPPDEDQGSEAIYGFDYQAHCTARLCLQMVYGHEIAEVVCEHHEDLIQIRIGRPPDFCQVKKRESARIWTIALLKDAIQKLFEKVQYRNVGQLVIYGSGRPSNDGECPLAGLIALLDRPESERDANWAVDLQPYANYLAGIFSRRIDLDTIERGLSLLKICLAMPNPEAIGAENVRLTAEVIYAVWGVEISVKAAERAYLALYRRVCEASRKPKSPRTMKSISRPQAAAILKNVLHDELPLAEKTQVILDINSKLQKGKLEAHVTYALQMRMDARQVKFEMELGATEWQDFKADLAEAWEDFQRNHPTLMGASLWRQLRDLLKQTGEKWASGRDNAQYGQAFAEGVFFDMMAVCEAEIGA
jgi:hypothetical protein